MRLDARRVIGLAVLFLATAVSSPASEVLRPPGTPSGLPPNGCGPDYSVGGWVVVVPVTLTGMDAGKNCQATLPAQFKRVCVNRGGLIVWAVRSEGCAKRAAKAVAIRQPTGKPGKTELLKLKRPCTVLDKVSPGQTQLITCEVAETAAEGLYEYVIEGEVDQGDPDIEVRKGG